MDANANTEPQPPRKTAFGMIAMNEAKAMHALLRNGESVANLRDIIAPSRDSAPAMRAFRQQVGRYFDELVSGEPCQTTEARPRTVALRAALLRAGRFTEPEKIALLSALREGRNLREVAAAFGRRPESVRYLAKRNGIGSSHGPRPFPREEKQVVLAKLRAGRRAREVAAEHARHVRVIYAVAQSAGIGRKAQHG